MFGKGLYFADCVSKSANYCYTYPGNDIGLVLMCEVALGTSKLMVDAFNVVDIPNADFQSIHAIGCYTPIVHGQIDNITVPLHGFQKSRTRPTLRLNYNEFVVYNPNQVKIKYLFKMKFNFKPQLRR